MMHFYPNAPKEVEFLKNMHRHIFHFKVYIQVFHEDRDIEFILFKRFIEELLDDFEEDMGSGSCEMIANFLYEEIKERDKYKGRHIKVEVSEDGENGVIMDYPNQ